MTEQKQIVPPQPGDITPIHEAEQQLAEVRERYAEVPDFSTKDGYQAGKKALQELTKLRTGTDKARLTITKPHRDFVDQVNRFAKGLVTEVEKIEAPFRDAKAEEDERREREKERRQQELRDKIARDVTAYLDTAVGLPSDALAGLLDEVEHLDAQAYYDLAGEAEEEINRVAAHLRSLLKEARLEEQLAAQQAEIARLRGQSEASEDLDDFPSMDDVNDLSDAWGDALEDLQTHCGLDASQAVETLTAIQNGQIAHVRFTA